jgi:glucose-1-phosphate thymidylyltransferase
MKALILSGGEGTRLRPITHTSAKQLIPVANKPILFYAIEAVAAAGIKDVGLIVGETREEVRKAVGSGERWDVNISYIEQEAPLGLAHAVKISQSFLKDESFVMYLGDNLIREGIGSLVAEFERDKPNAQILLARVENPERFGVAKLENGKVVQLIEKPKDPPSDFALVGVYMFDSSIFEAVNNIKPSWRHELEITDAIQYLIDAGANVKPHIIDCWWKDTGRLEDLLEANRIILEDLEENCFGEVDESSRLVGRVLIEKGAKVLGSCIRGPVIIGRNTVIENSYIGPFTSVYYDVLIRNSEVEHSIVLEKSKITDVSRVEDSLIGKGAEISKADLKPRAYRLMLGDHSRIGLI